MSIRRTLKAGAVPATVLALGASTVQAASAAVTPAASAPQPGSSSTFPSESNAMQLVGFDAGIAASHGYTIKTLSDGTQVDIATSKLKALGPNPSDDAIKAGSIFGIGSSGPTTGGGIHPNDSHTNYVYGNCGDSFIGLGINSDGTWKLTTGYDVQGVAFEVSRGDVGERAAVAGGDLRDLGPVHGGVRGEPLAQGGLRRLRDTCHSPDCRRGLSAGCLRGVTPFRL